MQKLFGLLVVCVFLMHCDSSQEPATAINIPMPEQSEFLDPHVMALLQQSAAEIRVDPSDSNRWAMHASALFANKYYESSVEAFETALELNPQMPQVMYIKTNALWRLNRQDQAIAGLTQTLTLIPEYDQGWRLLAQWQLSRGETQLAELHARKAFELNSARIGTRYILAQSLLDADKVEEALQLIEQAISGGNAPPWIYKLAATCYRRLGMEANMEAALAKAGPPLESWPDPLFQYLSKLIAGKTELTEYALWLLDSTGPKEALPFLIRAFDINSENTDLRAGLSIAFQNTGKLKKALQVLVGLQGEPNTNYWKQYAVVYITMSERSGDESWLLKAKGKIENSLALDKNDGTAHDLAARINLKLGQQAVAVSHWEQAGAQHIENEDWGLAELSFAFAIENGSSLKEVKLQLAFAQIQMGRFTQAQAIINALLMDDPQLVRARALQTMLPQELQQ